MFAFWDKRYKRIDIQRIGAQAPFRHLPVENFEGYVSIIGGNLAPALAAVINRYPYKTHVLRTEGFQSLDFHRRPTFLRIVCVQIYWFLPQ